jgi:hypothetical protein
MTASIVHFGHSGSDFHRSTHKSLWAETQRNNKAAADRTGLDLGPVKAGMLMCLDVRRIKPVRIKDDNGYQAKSIAENRQNQSMGRGSGWFVADTSLCRPFALPVSAPAGVGEG